FFYYYRLIMYCLKCKMQDPRRKCPSKTVKIVRSLTRHRRERRPFARRLTPERPERLFAAERPDGRRARVSRRTRVRRRLYVRRAGHVHDRHTNGAGLAALEGAEAGGDFGKVGTSDWHLVPAFHHDRVHARWAVLGAGEQLARPDHLDHLLVRVAVVWLQKNYKKN
ncbi:unnamed protein product, partial [Nesidiocoris tenuis]